MGTEFRFLRTGFLVPVASVPRSGTGFPRPGAPVKCQEQCSSNEGGGVLFWYELIRVQGFSFIEQGFRAIKSDQVSVSCFGFQMQFFI